MANATAVKTQSAAANSDKDPAYRAVVSELKTLRASIEQSTGKWSLTNEKPANTINRKVK